MKTTYVILGTGFEGFENGRPTGVPTSLRVSPTKWERNPGDRMNLEGVEYTVMTIFDTLTEANTALDAMAKLFVARGFWKGSRKSKAK